MFHVEHEERAMLGGNVSGVRVFSPFAFEKVPVRVIRDVGVGAPVRL
jgi:hypothetical protein